MRITALAAALLLSACLDSAPDLVQACRIAAKQSVTAPATYSEAGYENFSNNSEPSVVLRFDADNAYGTPQRMEARCEFEKGVRPPRLTALTVDGKKARYLASLNSAIRREMD